MLSKKRQNENNSNELLKADDHQTMTAVDRWLSKTSCMFEDAFDAIITGRFHSRAELLGDMDFSHLCLSHYCNLDSEALKVERTRMLALAAKDWQQGTIIRSPLEWTMVFREHGFEAKWLSLVQHRSASLVALNNFEELTVRLNKPVSTANQSKMLVKDLGRSKGGKARHAGSYASEIERRIAHLVDCTSIDLEVKAQRNQLIKRVCELYLNENKTGTGSKKPSPGTDITKINGISVSSRRTLVNYVCKLRKARRLLAGRVVAI